MPGNIIKQFHNSRYFWPLVALLVVAGLFGAPISEPYGFGVERSDLFEVQDFLPTALVLCLPPSVLIVQEPDDRCQHTPTQQMEAQLAHAAWSRRARCLWRWNERQVR